MPLRLACMTEVDLRASAGMAPRSVNPAGHVLRKHKA